MIIFYDNKANTIKVMRRDVRKAIVVATVKPIITQIFLQVSVNAKQHWLISIYVRDWNKQSTSYSRYDYVCMICTYLSCIYLTRRLFFL